MPNIVSDGEHHLFSGETNLSVTERALSVIGGLAIAAVGAQPRPNKLLSLAAVLAGSALAIRGATGHCPYGPLLGHEDLDRISDRS